MAERRILELYFAAPGREEKIARSRILSSNLSAGILGLAGEPPWFVDLPPGQFNFLWKNAGVVSLDLNRYWLNHYPEIEAKVREVLGATDSKDWAHSRHVMLEVVWNVGDHTLKFIDCADRALRILSPEKIFVGQPGTRGAEILFASARKLGIEARPIDGASP